MSNERSSLTDVVTQHRSEVMKLPGVHGIAGGLCQKRPGEKCILVYVTTDSWPDGLAEELGGYPVETIKTAGSFHPLAKPE